MTVQCFFFFFLLWVNVPRSCDSNWKIRLNKFRRELKIIIALQYIFIKIDSQISVAVKTTKFGCFAKTTFKIFSNDSTSCLYVYLFYNSVRMMVLYIFFLNINQKSFLNQLCVIFVTMSVSWHFFLVSQASNSALNYYSSLFRFSYVIFISEFTWNMIVVRELLCFLIRERNKWVLFDFQILSLVAMRQRKLNDLMILKLN